MSKTEILVSLITSLSKSEKRSVVMHSRRSDGEKDYIALFDIICDGVYDTQELQRRFRRERPGSSFDTTVKYLYNVVLNCLIEIRMGRDREFGYMSRLMKVKVLFEKSLYREGLAQLSKIEAQATKTEDYNIVFMALETELEVLTALDFGDLSEQQLVRRQVRMQESIRVVRNIYEHSFLYQLLRYRLSRKANVATSSKAGTFDDLIFSELNIVNKLPGKVFEISKNHLLFQANYFTGIGDTNQAFWAFTELNTLFEKNKHLWQNPPTDYLNVLEGTLSSLRAMGRYEDMDYFLDKLEGLCRESRYDSFRLEAMCIVFLYGMFRLLDRGLYVEALAFKWTNEKPLIDNLSHLNANRQAEIILYVSLLHYLNGNLPAAKKAINRIVFQGRDFTYLALYRAIRLVNLIYMYEEGEMNLIKSESRSILREMKEYSHRGSMEELFLRFINTSLPVTMSKRLELWGSYARPIARIRGNNKDKKLLSVFDFLSWIEAKITKRQMSDIVKAAIDDYKKP